MRVNPVTKINRDPRDIESDPLGTLCVEGPLKAAAPMDWRRLAKRIIALNDMGGIIEQRDGHRYITVVDELACSDLRALHDTKIYGSYSSALDAVDTAFSSVGRKTLESHFDSSVDYFDDLSNIFGE